MRCALGQAPGVGVSSSLQVGSSYPVAFIPALGGEASRPLCGDIVLPKPWVLGSVSSHQGCPQKACAQSSPVPCKLAWLLPPGLGSLDKGTRVPLIKSHGGAVIQNAVHLPTCSR